MHTQCTVQCTFLASIDAIHGESQSQYETYSIAGLLMSLTAAHEYNVECAARYKKPSEVIGTTASLAV